MSNIITFQGDSRIIRVTVKDEAGAIVNLSDMVIEWILAQSAGSVAKITKTSAPGCGITIADPTTGVFDVELSKLDTARLAGAYYHEAKITSPAGNRHTVVSGKITFTATTLK